MTSPDRSPPLEADSVESIVLSRITARELSPTVSLAQDLDTERRLLARLVRYGVVVGLDDENRLGA
jgi:hypothetical protein